MVNLTALVKHIARPIAVPLALLLDSYIAVLLMSLPSVNLTAGSDLRLIDVPCGDQLVSDIVTHDYHS